MPKNALTTTRTKARRGRSAAAAGVTLAGLVFSLVSTHSADAASVATWDKVAQCESSGDWSINTGNGYFGGVQISLDTWNAYGGRQYASYPNQATKQQQILIAEKILAGQGPVAWPNCGRVNGLGTDTADPYPATPPAPVGMVQLTAADFTGDGKADLVGIEAATGKLWLYPGTGNGTLGERVQIGSGWGGMSKLAAADFTGDGKADLVTVENATGNLYVYPGTGTLNGMNTLGARTQIGSGWGAMRDLTAIDVNQDHTPDLLAVDPSGALWAYPGTGTLNGTATLGNRVQIGSGWGSMAELTSPGDLDGDGKADLVAVDPAGALWKYSGTGALNGMNTLGARSQIGSGWNSMRQLVGADFNGDGKGDLDAVQAPTGSTGGLFFYPGNGNGGFADRAQIGTGW
ncbi:FG-GAP-like repeat-containing protein [Kitasatospora aureofaciens]|uniref:FG-GAP-like repeat-containing protein n=1 Tax=Kitasatospora aureofaciens TaxID=1894 RepID=UPI0036F455C5